MTKEEINKEISLLDSKLKVLHKDLNVIEQKEYKELLKNRAKTLRSYVGKKVVIRTLKEYIICIMLKITRQKVKYEPFRIYTDNYVSFDRTQVDCMLRLINLECSCDSSCCYIDASEGEDDVVLYDEHPVKAQFDKVLNFMKNF